MIRTARHSRRIVAAAVALALMLSPLAQPTALATGPWHNNVNVIEFAGGIGYTGLKVSRSGYLSGLILANCNYPVYDTMWVWIPNASGRWLEIGVRYVCDIYGDPYHDVFIGYGTNPTTFYWLDYTDDGTSSATHTYAIKMDYGGDNAWDYYIDGANEYADLHFSGESTSDRLQVVLETYDDATIIPSHSEHNFLKRRYAGTWADWSGEDSGPPNPPAPLCGFWTSPTAMQGVGERDMLVKSAPLLVIAVIATACSSLAGGAPSEVPAAKPTAMSSVNSEATPALPAAPSQTSQDPEGRCMSLRSVTPVPGAATATVVAAYATNEAGFVRLRNTILESSGGADNLGGSPQATPMPSAVAAQPVLICYLEGQFGPLIISASPAATESGPTRLVVRIGEDAVVEPIAIGPDGSIPIVDPNQLETTAPPQ